MNSPPIKVWILVLTISAISFTTYYWFSFKNFGNVAQASKIKKLLVSNNVLDSGKTSVMIVGSSITHCAFGTNNNLQQILSHQIGKPIALLKINIDALNLERASELKIFKMISDNPPNILFLESRLLVKFIFNPKKIPLHLQYSISKNIGELKVKLGLLKKDDSVSVISPPWPTNYFTGVFDNAAYKAILNRKRIVLGFNENTELNEAFRKMRANHTKIIFLGYPNIASINKAFAKNDFQLAPIFAQYKKEFQIDYWQNRNIPSENKFYFDGSHLNYEGSKKYVDWFLSQIKTRL